MELKNVIFSIVFLISFGFLGYNLNRILSYLKLGQKADRFDNPKTRIKNVLKIAFGQSKLLQDPMAGLIHFFIFWGFVLFLGAVVESVLQGFYTPFNLEFLGPIYSLITLSQDVLGSLVLVSLAYAVNRRYILKVKRLQGGTAEKLDAALVLFMIAVVVISMFGQNITHIAKNNLELATFEVRPISIYLAKIIYTDASANVNFMYEVYWWIHIVAVFGFMNYLPYSKHFHVFTSIPNVYFAKHGNEKYALKKLDLEDEEAEQFGVADMEHLTWKQMLDGFSCTECGRCTAVCPAANTGKLLSPRKIIVDIRKRTEQKSPYLLKGIEEQAGILDKTLVHDFISDEELWACTTCNACVYECPVTIEHVDSIVDMRRNLVLMESEFPPELNTVFKNLETNFTPWAFNAQDRANWAEGMDIKTLAEDPNGEILFWVGCSGSFDSRYQNVTKSFAKIMQKAGVDFRILGTEEKCNGDSARRLGNEYLAQMMMMDNVETLNNYGVKKIVTGCPHCFNSLKNEFPQFGGEYEVIHHSEMIDELISDGKIKLKEKSEISSKTTFHDSCYLGRYNGIYDEPRDSISKINGLELVEMERNKQKGFCCGAGGGRMFLEETEGQRINENRTKEALETGADTIASSCPFCMTMMTDGVKTFEKADEVKVKDIAEIVLENSV
ncbi:MAG: 4Fe-4S dicluster domain-containing protein [Melioribacteraceae bacterium]|nr:4Fe-4S dicluster domain-containing protein [Melioribacteraceae bacterium]MCF8264552.1 4Fe-4S dicluster domain-containing protein [Melioribacteraceae bacterium]MCF8413746.1 4Fe-4S dicluster domain-containing protein [Melioribacteraceae bacterium]MCF8432588.1 4Fe-4S dicluster domain-containing protein [Melioribacteraceae bacterium]